MLTVPEIQILQQSAIVGAIATAVALPPAIALAYTLAFKQIKGKPLLTALALLPIALPPLALSTSLFFILYGLAKPEDILTIQNLKVSLFFQATACSTILLTIPLILLPTLYHFKQADLKAINTARTLGATLKDALKLSLLPKAKYAIAAGTLLAFTRSFSEIFIVRLAYENHMLYRYEETTYTDPKLILAALAVFALLTILAAIHLMKKTQP